MEPNSQQGVTSINQLPSGPPEMDLKILHKMQI